MAEAADRERWEAIEKVLDRALDLPPERRPEFLDETCAGDTALRAEVESLLEAHQAAGDYLEVPAASLEPALAEVYSPGQELGPYRLIEEIGRGGLGLVYLAEDTRLNRQVALKLLPASRITDPRARARFQREARAASALDHPNICTVHEMGESEGGDPYIAMAYVEGESLKERIARGPLPLSDAMDFAIQTAQGLAHAHHHGIVHRDIKPANLIVTPEGRVKIVDFGLAKGRGDPTLTREGVIPGTVAYMSPEQLTGQAVDHRSDIWTLGVVLYEMITGRPPFRGDDERSRSHAILNQDPEPLSALRTGVPLSLDAVLSKALSKDPESRYQHVDELSVDLGRVREDRPGAVPGVAGSRQGWKVGMGFALVLSGVAMGVLAASVALKRDSGSEAHPPMHLSVTLPPDLELSGAAFRRFALSPDGRQLVFAAGVTGRHQLYLRSLDRDESRPIPGTENGLDPFFSPDGRWVGFFADQELRKVRLDGGAPLRICDAPTETSRGATWVPDGTIILPLGQLSGLFRVPDSGGDPEPLTVPSAESGTSGHFFPQFLPSQRKVLFTIWNGREWTTAVLSLDTDRWDEVAHGCAAARYLPTGHMICSEMQGIRATGNLLVAPFRLEEDALVGSFVPVPGSPNLDEFDFAVSPNGILVYAAGTAGMDPTALVWVDRAGRPAPSNRIVGGYLTPAISPDGRQLAVTRIVEAGREELWRYDLETGTPARLSSASVVSNLPVWSPDGERILFNSLQSRPGLYWVSRDLGDTLSLLLPRGEHILVPGSFSAGGRILAYTELNPLTLGDLWTLSLDDGSTTPLLRTRFNERTPVFSPDGRWLAYASDVSGRDEVYVQAFPGPGAPVQVSDHGGREPLWSRNGREMFYRSEDAVMAVPVQTEGPFAAGRPIRLFEDSYAREYKGKSNYDVGPDGRFVMVSTQAASPAVRLDILVNWLEGIEDLVSSKPERGRGGG